MEAHASHRPGIALSDGEDKWLGCLGASENNLGDVQGSVFWVRANQLPNDTLNLRFSFQTKSTHTKSHGIGRSGTKTCRAEEQLNLPAGRWCAKRIPVVEGTDEGWTTVILVRVTDATDRESVAFAAKDD